MKKICVILVIAVVLLCGCITKNTNDDGDQDIRVSISIQYTIEITGIENKDTIYVPNILKSTEEPLKYSQWNTSEIDTSSYISFNDERMQIQNHNSIKGYSLNISCSESCMLLYNNQMKRDFDDTYEDFHYILDMEDIKDDRYDYSGFRDYFIYYSGNTTNVKISLHLLFSKSITNYDEERTSFWENEIKITGELKTGWNLVEAEKNLTQGD